MQVVIIAGGLGTRLGSLTLNQPKSLIKVNDKPFIDYQLEFLIKGGIESVVLCVGHQGEQIREYCGDGSRYGLTIKYSREAQLLDTAGALKLAEPLLEDYFFTLYGDSYMFINFREMLAKLQLENKPAAMSVYQNHDLYDKSNTAVKNGLVTYYSKEKRDSLTYIEYGVNLFRKEVLKLIPEAEPYSMGTLFNQLIRLNALLAYEVKERFYEIGTVNGINDFTEYIRRRQ
jgi:MurNAc alpha-1-phosphate uridylyltransferase